MKKTTLIALLFLILGNLCAQKNIENSALFNANKMISCYNNKDFINYVNYLLPQTYGNNPAYKEQFVDLWKNLTRNDTAKIQIIKVLKTSAINGQYQAVLLNSFRNQDGYIFGISNDKGKNWFFTTSYSTELKFDQIIDIIPTVDTAFSKFVDPRFGKRITYNIGKSIASFSYNDIKGILVSADSLKGKVIVMNFWSIGCGPCIAEMPELNNLVERMKGKEVVFIAPTLYTTKEELDHYFFPKHSFEYQIVLLNGDDYSVTSFPTHLVIDQNLKVVEKLVGANPENIKKIEQKINEITK